MQFERRQENPILKPSSVHPWDAEAAFNGCPIKRGNKIYLVYRALSLPQYHTMADATLKMSSVGIAESKDGVEFHRRRILFGPEQEWERFGCEDPRVTEFEGKYFIFYTAISTFPFSAQGIKVGLAITKDLEHVEERHLITPFNAKAMAMFPRRIKGKITAILTTNTDLPDTKICLAHFDKVEDMWNEEYWQKWYQGRDDYALPLQRRAEDRIEVGSVPIETEKGWLLFYSYIDNYFSSKPVFTIEAMLLDLDEPTKIVARTNTAVLTTEEYYERIGIVPNVIFPSGALLRNEMIYLYYGGADTVCCLATAKKELLLDTLSGKNPPVKFERFGGNPVIQPNRDTPWETKATFNPGAIFLDGKVHIVYRAMSDNNTSVFGYASSSDGLHFDFRSPSPIYTPRESFEQKEVPWGNSGCEDPRLTLIGDKIYMCYTAFNGKNPPRVAVMSISRDDFVNQRWNWSKPVLISSPNLDDKDACIFPELINGKYFVIHRYGNDIDTDFVPSLDFDGKTWLDEYSWVTPRPGMWDGRKVGLAAPPLKTENGWILFYHGVSDDDGHYRVGALLLDLNDPTKILARTEEPLLEPEEKYEKEGQISNVVFPGGAVILGDKIFLYYGGADSVVGVATISVKKLIDYLKKCGC